jgi:hypothetical protein
MRLGRNDPCHCGSGRKYKKCCLQKDQSKGASQVPREKQLRFDPRILISGPYIRCPNCREEEFGVIMISGHSYTRRCRNCWHAKTYGLPPIRKKVIYLDQLVISNITKALDPESKGHQNTIKNPFWLEAYRKLDHLSKLQLLICPDSHFHHDESLLSGDPPYDSLRELYEHLSNGCTFYNYNTILREQIDFCFWAYLRDNPDCKLNFDADHVVHGNLHEWYDRLRISVNSSPYEGEADATRKLRDQQYQELVRAFEQWKSDKTPYAQSFAEEAAAWGRATIEIFARYLQHYAQLPTKYVAEIVRTGTYTPKLEDILRPPAAELIFGLLSILESIGIRDEEALAKIGEYFRSPHLLNVPYIRLSSMLYASLARKAGAGQMKLPSKGTFTDVNAIASLLPYCDAIFVDAEMAGHLGDNPLRKEAAKYSVRVFSLRNQNEFFEFLDVIEREAKQFHLEMVKQIYGENWGEPYMSLITDSQRRARKGG